MIHPDRPFVTRSGLFLVAAVLGVPAVAAAVAVAAPMLAALQPRAMPVLAANHLVTLGWGTMVAMGALHQLLPAAAGVRREPPPAVTAQFAVHLLGVAIFLWLAAGTLRRRTRWLPVLGFATFALACLGAAVGWGLLLVLNWRFAFWKAALLPAGLAVHLALGLLGWFAGLVIGVSYYLLPRFAGTGDLAARWQRMVLICLTAAVTAVALGALLAPVLVRAGLLLAGAAGLLYAADIFRIVRAWRPGRPDITRAHWWVLLFETVLLSLGAWAWALGLLPGQGMRWGVAGVALFLLGWVTLAIAGQGYKVTPFLMWYYRFHLGLAPLEVSRLEAPYWPWVGVPPFVLLAAGGLLIPLGVVLASPPVSLAGGLAFFAGACAYAFVLGYSWLPRLWPGRRPHLPAESR